MRESRHITGIEMRTLLREAYSQDPEKSFLEQLGRRFHDPAKPKDMKKHQPLHPLWLTLGLIAALIAGIFAYFSLRS